MFHVLLTKTVFRVEKIAPKPTFSIYFPRNWAIKPCESSTELRKRIVSFGPAWTVEWTELHTAKHDSLVSYCGPPRLLDHQPWIGTKLWAAWKSRVLTCWIKQGRRSGSRRIFAVGLASMLTQKIGGGGVVSLWSLLVRLQCILTCSI